MFRLMLVTDNELVGKSNLLSVISNAVKGGVDAIQIREKNMCYRELFDLTYEVKRKLGDQARIFINGNPEIARDLGVGLHLPSQLKLNDKFDEDNSEPLVIFKHSCDDSIYQRTESIVYLIRIFLNS